MQVYSFDPENYNPDIKTITLHGPVYGPDGNRESSVMVCSNHTNVSMKFEYNSDETTEEYMNNEGWDGEQMLAIFKNGDITLRVWQTPYDEFITQTV